MSAFCGRALGVHGGAALHARPDADDGGAAARNRRTDGELERGDEDHDEEASCDRERLHRRGHAKSAANSERIAYSANPMSFVEELTWRGLVQQSTDPELAAKMRAEPFTLYIGFDPTADSCTSATCCRCLTLMRAQRAGHKPIALVGGATGMIGDPSGKSEERKLLSLEELRHNVARLGAQIERFLDFGAGDARAGQQLRLVQRLRLPRFSARHRQELQRQHDAGQGLGARAPRGPRAGHLATPSSPTC